LMNLQHPLPSSHFINQPAQGSRSGQTKALANNIPVPQSTAQQAKMATQPTPQQLYAHYQAAAAQQQRLNAQAPNGRSTPQGPPISRSPLNPNQAAVSRSSPSQALAARSPMLPPNQPVSQMTHPPQHLSYAVAPNQYNHAHMRMVHPNGSPHPQTLSSHLVAGGTQSSPSPVQAGQQQQPTSLQEQAHPPQSMVAQYPTHMFSYPQMSMNYAMQPRGPPGYSWPLGRGQPMAGMPTAALPQQMPKAVQGALPGR
jgi:hypothetical protein